MGERGVEDVIADVNVNDGSSKFGLSDSKSDGALQVDSAPSFLASALGDALLAA